MSGRRSELTALLALLWACGGDGGPADPGNGPDLQDSWAFAESYADGAHTVSCIDEGTFYLIQTNGTFTGQASQAGTCQTPAGTQDNSGTADITAGRVSSAGVSFTFGGCDYQGTLFGSDSLAGTVMCRATIGAQIIRLDGTWSALKGELTPPTVTATLQPPEGDYVFVPQDQLRVVLTAADDRKLSWVGYR